MNLRLIYIQVLIIFCVILSSECIAQNYGGINMHFQIQNTIMQSIRGINYSINPSYTFSVIMKDGSTKVVKSKILTDTALHQTYLLLVDKSFPKSDSLHRNQKIYASSTQKISRQNGDSTLTGMSADSCWIFKVSSGLITAYSMLSETDYLSVNSASLVAIQPNNGTFTKFKPEILEAIFANDDAAKKLLKKKMYIEAIIKYNRNKKNYKKETEMISN